MSDKLYRIRKLVWDTCVTNSRREWIALCLDSPIAGLGYFVKERRSMWVWKESGGEWIGAATFDAAKLAAEAHWVSRVESCLEEVPQ